MIFYVDQDIPCKTINTLITTTVTRSFHIFMLWRSKWRITTFCYNINMRKLLVILVVIKLYAESIYIINTFGFSNSLEVLPWEINLRNKKILASLEQLYSALSFYSTTHDHLPDRQYYSGHLLMAALKFYLKRRNCRAHIFFARYLFLPFLHDFIYIFFLSGLSFTDTDDSEDNRGREGIIFYSTLPIPPTHEHSDTCLQLCMWDDYHTFLISTLVIAQH